MITTYLCANFFTFNRLSCGIYPRLIEEGTFGYRIPSELLKKLVKAFLLSPFLAPFAQAQAVSQLILSIVWLLFVLWRPPSVDPKQAATQV